MTLVQHLLLKVFPIVSDKLFNKYTSLQKKVNNNLRFSGQWLNTPQNNTYNKALPNANFIDGLGGNYLPSLNQNITLDIPDCSSNPSHPWCRCQKDKDDIKNLSKYCEFSSCQTTADCGEEMGGLECINGHCASPKCIGLHYLDDTTSDNLDWVGLVCN